MKAGWFCASVLCLLAACGQSELDTVTFEGERFTGDLRSERRDRASFVAQGGPASVSLEGAKQAASYQVVQHCISYLGSSDVAWINGPDVPDDQLLIENDRVVLTGRCIEP
ncbi:hypothetical protein [Marivita sp. XM-24bin2]|uniref:hypothetical protein n=1 Tax=unclassified Marivita TaxID=2632480 RepID=UPI000D798594|nr:hypothetical protein [Marivita sp. XM-24bin2]MCR9107609.1 hypothetical protein [Paracoccaceae bacterium]PWL34872.1 MAG: hypothetical protein DCO97_12255 [Marivita sp. XM-24bin2]